MSGLLHAKRDLETVTGPVTFERGEFYPTDWRRRGETHYVLASARFAGEPVSGTGRDHLEALAELDEIVTAQQRALVAESLSECRGYFA